MEDEQKIDDSGNILRCDDGCRTVGERGGRMSTKEEGFRKKSKINLVDAAMSEVVEVVTSNERLEAQSLIRVVSGRPRPSVSKSARATNPKFSRSDLEEDVSMSFMEAGVPEKPPNVGDSGVKVTHEVEFGVKVVSGVVQNGNGMKLSPLLEY
eukprot:TRINITY_DN200_c0_g1_i1.p1 TRINITY_DN200_c0_g1~~TRINITY_DN200_c0_g1_i1.p1  ORF type:complete len:153 (+),score=31.86 TRINITY_DN200_c0_g1_i1:924-1382(+)